MGKSFQVEVAGMAITLNDEEAALVVYMDNNDCGHMVRVKNGVDLQEYTAIAQVIERSVEGKPISAAIFPRLPILGQLKPSYENQKSGSYEVDFNRSNLSEIVTLFAGNISELDWRRRK